MQVSSSTIGLSSSDTDLFETVGRELFRTSAVFRKSILELDAIYKSVLGQSLIELTGIFDGARPSDPLGEIWPIAITLVSLTMLQIALFDTLAALGIKPDVVVGHSAGETPVLYASGAGSRALAMELAIARGKAMSLLETEKGTMAAVSCSPERTAEIVEGVLSELGPGTLEVGCYNAPGAVTLSGHENYVERAVKAASDAGIFARRLRTRIPVHSAMMEHCEEEYKRLVEDVFSRYRVSPTTVETWSTKTGALQESLYDAEYYWDSTRGPVRFTEAVQGIAQKHPHAIYVELGPHPVLTSYVSAITEQKTAAVVCPLRRPRSSERQPVETGALLEAIGKLVVAGYTRVEFDALFGTAPAPVDVLPAYPFARITAAEMGSEQLWSYVGRTSDDSPLVAGVACGPLSNVVVAHKFALYELTAGATTDSLPSTLPAAIPALAVGVSAFSRPEYLSHKVILVTHSNTVLGVQVAKLYSELGADVISSPASYTISALKDVFAL